MRSTQILLNYLFTMPIFTKLKWSYTNFFHCTIIIDRMPVILGDKESTDTWLNGSSSSKFDNMLKPYEDVDLVRAI